MTIPETKDDSQPRVTVERDGRILLIGLNRPEKLNAFDDAMVDQLNVAYTMLERDRDLWCGVLHAHGKTFTAGLNLSDFAERWKTDENPFAPPAGQIDPWDLVGEPRTKPIVAAVQGRCFTLGIELLLAADVRIAGRDAVFAQIEILRGIYPVGGATLRFADEVGWGNAMRYLLTADAFDAAEALRIGFVQEVCDAGEELVRARALAAKIVEAAPSGVRLTRSSAKMRRERGYAEALARMLPDLYTIMNSNDTAEGVRSFIERRKAVFTGE